MHDVLCIYYSNTGNTKFAMEEIAEALDAELVEVSDGVERDGFWAKVKAGMEAMRRSTHPLLHFDTERHIEEYRLVIVGTPVWAGRCASPVRGLLKRRGLEMSRVAYVLTRASDKRYEEIYKQMDLYTAQPHLMGVSLRPGDAGYEFWLHKLIGDARRYLGESV